MRKRIKKKPILIATVIFLALAILSFACLIYSILRVANIENFLRYAISGIIFLIALYYFLMFTKIVYKGKNIGIIFFDIFLVITFVITIYICGVINGIYNKINNISKDKYTYSTSLISLSSSEYEKIDNLKDSNIGIIKKQINNDLYDTTYESINNNNLKDKNKIIEYESNIELVDALYNNEVDAIFLPTSYKDLFNNNENYKNIESETKIIYTYEKEFKKFKISTKDSNDPITILALGMDSTESDISKVTSFNADTIMLITFNPKTYKATILSIPRDTYVPIMCLNNNVESKITHSGWGGEKCVMDTIENFTDIKIDYYVKVNFTALVKLVDEIGGVDVDVPFSFCEQDSQRRWGNNTIYVEKGLHTLNGEEALALSRNRHPNPDMCSSKWTNYYADDIVRGENQQLVLSSLINKIASNIDLNTIYNLMDIIGSNVATNMTTNEITSYYNVVKDMALNAKDNNIINFERLSLSTYGKYLYDGAQNMSGISMQIYYEDSLKDIVKEMKINLDIEKPELIKTINYNINIPYEKHVIGTGNYKATVYNTVPNFKDEDASVAINWANKNNVKINVEYVDTTDGITNTIISQSIPSTYRVDKINTTLTIKVRNITE